MTEFNVATSNGELYVRPPLTQRLRNMAERVIDGVLYAPYGYDVLYPWKPDALTEEDMRTRVIGLLKDEGHGVQIVEVTDIVPMITKPSEH